MHFERTENLKEGMIITRSLYTGGQLLLSANRKITVPIIDALKRTKRKGIYIYDEFSEIEDLAELVDERTRIDAINAIEELNTDQVMFLATDIVEGIMEKGGDIVLEVNNLSVYDQSTYEHSINVAMSATLCGVGLGLDNQKLERLAAAAMLHDVGKRYVPIEIITKKGKLTDEERRVIERHPQYGYDILYNRADIHPEVRAAVLCHHENEDGSGYGKGLKGDEIPFLAKIIHVADVYDALVKKRSYKEGMSQQESIEYLMGGCGTYFNLEVVSAFLHYIPVYPVGTDVFLSDGRKARVVRNVKGCPERPVVVAGGEILDLAGDKGTYSITIVKEATAAEEGAAI